MTRENFLYDVSSFANTPGGDTVFGIVDEVQMVSDISTGEFTELIMPVRVSASCFDQILSKRQKVIIPRCAALPRWKLA